MSDVSELGCIVADIHSGQKNYKKIREFGIRNIKKVEVVVYSPYVPVMVPAYSRRNNMQQVPSIDSL